VIELAVIWLTHSNFHDVCLKINCNNMSMIASFWKCHPHNPAHNEIILRLSSSLAASNLTIEPSYIQSTFNKDNGLSSGILVAIHRPTVVYGSMVRPVSTIKIHVTFFCFAWSECMQHALITCEWPHLHSNPCP